MSHAVDFHGEVLVRYIEFFFFCDGFEDKALTNLFFSGLFIVLTELFFGLADVLQVVSELHVSGFEVHGDLFDDLVNALVDHFVRDIDLGIGYSLRYESFMVGFFCLLDSLQLHLLFHRSLQVIHFIELADGFCESIIKSRQLFAFYIIDVYFEFCFFAFERIDEVGFREGDLDFYVIARFMAFELFFKARDEALGADFQRIGLAFAAFERFAVYEAFEVDDSVVAFGKDSAFFCLFEACALFSCFFQFSFDLCIGNFRFFMGCFEAFVFAQFYFRTFYKSSGEFCAFGFREEIFLHIRLGDRDDLFLLHSFGESAIDDDIFRFSDDSFLAEMHFQYLAACLAFAETRDSDLVCNASYSLLESFLYSFCRQFNGERYLVLIQCLYFYVHKNYSSLSRFFRQY